VRGSRPLILLAAAVVLLAAVGCSSGSGGAEKRVIAPSPSPVPTPSPPRPAVFTVSGELTQGGWLRGKAPDGTVSLKLGDKAVSVAPDGIFFVAFDRDSGTSMTLVARLDDGRDVARALTISPRAWNIEHVAVGPRPGSIPSAEYKRRRDAELARINAARAKDTQSQGWRQRFVWPVRGRISGNFGSQRIYRGTPGGYHSGTDIATGESGTLFVAPADGIVILAADAPFTLEGRLLMIDHGMGLNSAFLHNSQLLVREGESVRQGQPIGRIGATGRATGPHLHWSIKWWDARLDPVLFTGPM
jgi:hypothetical protein